MKPEVGMDGLECAGEEREGCDQCGDESIHDIGVRVFVENASIYLFQCVKHGSARPSGSISVLMSAQL